MTNKYEFEYKRNIQKKLFQRFNKEYYSKEEIAEILGVNINTAEEITSRLLYHEGKGYERLDIVLICMNGVLYAR